MQCYSGCLPLAGSFGPIESFYGGFLLALLAGFSFGRYVCVFIYGGDLAR